MNVMVVTNSLAMEALMKELHGDQPPRNIFNDLADTADRNAKALRAAIESVVDLDSEEGGQLAQRLEDLDEAFGRLSEDLNAAAIEKQRGRIA